MILRHLVASIGGIVYAFVYAAPAKTGFSTECSDLRINQGWLIGSCPTGVDSATRIESSIYLGSWLMNNEGFLNWAANGAYQRTCSECTLVENGAVLQCSCRHSWRGAEVTAINLEDYIANYNGHLLSSLGGTPSIPKDSSVPVPGDFSHRMELADGGACSRGFEYHNQGPGNCVTVWIAGTVAMNFSSAAFTSPNNGWEFQAFSDTDCRGTTVAVVSPGDGNACRAFDSALSFSVRPLWNAN